MKRRAFARVALAACLSSAALPSPARAQGAPPPARAQADKPAARHDLVAKGQELFDDQRYEESIQALSAALLRPNNSTERKVEIYRLLSLNYITLGRQEEAESAVRGLLVIDPDYALPDTESPRFRDFFTEVRTKWEEEGRPGLAAPEVRVAPVALRHAPASQVDAGKQLDVQARLEDPDQRVASVRLYYRSGTRGPFREVDAQRDGSGVRAQIPGSAVKPPLVEYYVAALDEGGNVVASRGDDSAPLRVAVPERSKGWVLPVAIGGGILGAAAIVGGLALAGVFSSGNGGGAGTSVVSVSVSESSRR
jgi:tetratricopeptide (TPR) repeat protein